MFPENIQRGRGLKGLGNSSGVRHLKTLIHLLRARTTIVSQLFLWVILVLLSAMPHFSYHASAQNDFFFDSCFKANYVVSTKDDYLDSS